MGWNDGRNPLPFVLVEDVADAIARAALKPELSGQSLNLVGEVTMTAREYIEELARALGRPLRFHGQMPEKLYLLEWGKWGVKRLAGRSASSPSYRDFRSRGCLASFDCSDTRAALGWAPVSKPDVFVEKAIRVHVRESTRRRTNGKSRYSRFRNRPEPAFPLILNVFSTFAIGGPQVRFAALANSADHSYRQLLLAMDGRYDCLAAESRVPEFIASTSIFHVAIRCPMSPLPIRCSAA